MATPVALLAKLRAAVAALADLSVADAAHAGHASELRATAAALCASAADLSRDSKQAVWEVALRLWCAYGQTRLRARVCDSGRTPTSPALRLRTARLTRAI